MIMHATKNPMSVIGVFDRKEDLPMERCPLIAVAVVSALNSTGAIGVADGGIENGHQLDAVHLSSSYKRATAVYIAGAYAISTAAKGAVIAILLDRVRTYAGYRSVEAVYARASTRSGLNLLRRRGFRPIQDGSAMHERQTGCNHSAARHGR